MGSYCASFLIFLCFLFHPIPAIAAQEEAIFAGGCFWCLEHDLEEIRGVNSVYSGYSGGELTSPTYSNHAGHQESVIVNYQPEEISYQRLLRSYWRNVDPIDGNGQFCDRGDAYRPVIFFNNELQRMQAVESAENAARELNLPIDGIKVEIRGAGRFWLAEDYHQNFANRNAIKYNFYRYSCGRDSRLKEIWGDKAQTDDNWLIDGPE